MVDEMREEGFQAKDCMHNLKFIPMSTTVTDIPASKEEQISSRLVDSSLDIPSSLLSDSGHQDVVMFIKPRPYSRRKDPLEIKKRRVRAVVFSSIALVLLFRISLPYLILDHVNTMLAHRSDYCGSVEDIEVSLLSGSYTMKGVTFYKLEGSQKENVPFFSAPALDFSIDWQRVLRKGAFVGKVVLKNAVSKARPKKLYVKASIYHLKQAMKVLVLIPVENIEISSKEQLPAVLQ